MAVAQGLLQGSIDGHKSSLTPLTDHSMIFPGSNVSRNSDRVRVSRSLMSASTTNRTVFRSVERRCVPTLLLNLNVSSLFELNSLKAETLKRPRFIVKKTRIKSWAIEGQKDRELAYVELICHCRLTIYKPAPPQSTTCHMRCTHRLLQVDVGALWRWWCPRAEVG